MKTAHFEEPWYTPALKAFLLEDVPRLLGIPQEVFARDVSRLEQRLACEGESFLTKTLPALGQNIDRALQGNVPLVANGFKKVRSTAIPAFLQEMHKRVFKDTGWLKEKPCIISIRLLRQICLWCKKIEKGYSDESLQQAINEFVEVDQVLPECHATLHEPLLGTARAIIEHIFADICDIPCRPQHGPGAVASGDSAVDKRKLNHRYVELERVFRPIPWFFSLRDASESPWTITDRIACAYGLSRTEFVEKDSKGPRTIGLEPAEYMWVQQAVKRWMYHHIEHSSVVRGQINFIAQEINRMLALLPRGWVTLDMSKASDRNSYALVRTLFKRTRLWPYLRASRTPGTVLPDGRILMYRKFAPMGSAVCFPVQACVYYALACAALHHQGIPLALTFRLVFVYGDDLIVPPEFSEGIFSLFERVGLRFNANKCCTHGLFRESCGVDAYDGAVVTPVRMRKVYQMRQHSVIPSIVEHANSLMKAGYWGSAAAFRTSALATYPYIRELRLPYTTDPALPVLAWLHTELDTVKRFVKRSIPYVVGTVFKPNKLEANADSEARYLRESLSLEGPVGECRRALTKRASMQLGRYGLEKDRAWFHECGPQPSKRVCYDAANSRFECRVLTAKYTGSLRRKAIPYWRCGEESRTTAVRVERLARNQT